MTAYVRRFGTAPRLMRISLGAAAIGAIGLAVGAVIAPGDLFVAYLTACAYTLSVVFGALIFLMICHAMRAKWPVALRRLLEAIVGTLPLAAVLFVPVLFGIPHLYPWAHPSSIADEQERALVEHKVAWLNAPFFVVRSATYLAVCLAVAALLLRWSLTSDADPRRDVSAKLQALSAGALPAVGFAVSFAAFDWLMSLTPAWFSTMYPVYWFAGGILGAIAALTILTTATRDAGLLPEISPSHDYALGRLLLTFTIFWAYAAFFQFLIVWMADRPDEATYYAVRMREPWAAWSVVLILAQFVLPFALLLSHDLKLRPRPLTAVAVWLLAAHYVDSHWLVAPAARPNGPVWSWLDLAALLAVGGALIAYGAWRLRGLAVMPVHDPALAEGLRYESR